MADSALTMRNDKKDEVLAKGSILLFDWLKLRVSYALVLTVFYKI